jgi:hypothetical protein
MTRAGAAVLLFGLAACSKTSAEAPSAAPATAPGAGRAAPAAVAANDERTRRCKQWQAIIAADEEDADRLELHVNFVEDEAARGGWSAKQELPRVRLKLRDARARLIQDKNEYRELRCAGLGL